MLASALLLLGCQNETAVSRIQAEDAAMAPVSLTIGMPSGTASSTIAAPLHDGDVDFVMMTFRHGLHMTNLAKLGAERAASEPVRELAKRMIRDHTRANEELAALAQSKRLGLPIDVEIGQIAMEKSLSGLSGPAFDTAYLNAMVADHETAAEAMRGAVEATQSAEIQELAMRNLPVIEERLQLARGLAASLATR